MPEFIGGLPLHPLVVHFVVVLLPIAVLGAVLTAVWPAVRRRFGWLAVAAAAAGTALVPFATDSGEDLSTRIGMTPQIREHQELGDLMIWWALALTVAVAALMVVHTRTTRARAREDQHGDEEAPANRGAVVSLVVAAVLTVGLAVGTGIHVFRVGDAGSRSVWEDVKNLPPKNNGG